MLVNLKNICKIAEAEKCAIGAFNTPNLTSLKAVIGAAEELAVPVTIMHAQVHEEMGLCRLSEIGDIMLLLADNATVPVCVHLDHGTSLDYLKKALDMGFTSIMYDGSELSYEKNSANTCIAVEMAVRYGASVEAEIGSMGARESSADPQEGCPGQYTDPATAKRFVEETGIDALACAFGTAHGLYTKEPKLDFERVEKIRSLIKIPLVMHGGSGVSAEDYKKVIACGIRKINYYTYMAKAGAAAVNAAERKTFYHEIENVAIQAMKANVKQAMEAFAMI